jgi:hypothetical protein
MALKSLPRYFVIVRAFAGDSTTIRFLDMVIDEGGYPSLFYLDNTTEG